MFGEPFDEDREVDQKAGHKKDYSQKKPFFQAEVALEKKGKGIVFEQSFFDGVGVGVDAQIKHLIRKNCDDAGQDVEMDVPGAA